MEFLEEAISASPASPAVAPAAAVSQAWTRLRSPHHQDLRSIEQSLRLLAANKKSLHVSEPQVRSLLSLLAALPRDADSSPALEILSSARASAALVISVWIRRSLLDRNSGPRSGGSSSAATTLDGVAREYSAILRDEAMDSCSCQSILLLGAVCAARECRSESRELCCVAIAEELRARKTRYVRETRWIPEALAGLGYAMMGDSGEYSFSVLVTKRLAALWTTTTTSQVDGTGMEQERGTGIEEDRGIGIGLGMQRNRDFSPSLEICAMVSRLYEFVATSSSQHRALESVSGAVIDGDDLEAVPAMEIAKVAIAAGLLRGFKKLEILQGMRRDLEKMISEAASRLIRRICDETGRVSYEEMLELFGENQVLKVSDGLRHRLRCMALSVASCSRFAQAQPDILLCLVLALLGDVLDFYSSSSGGTVSETLRAKVDGVLFRVVGSLARTVCEQYRGVSSIYQQQIESVFWRFSSKLYRRHRIFPSMPLLDETNKALEAMFLTIVLFFSSCTEFLSEREDLAAYILDSFSCVEFLRRFQVDEYTDAVKKCALLVSKSRKASSQLAELMPSYQDAISCLGRDTDLEYSWFLDDVQTSRVQFYFRVLPSCLQQLDSARFENHVVPILFLYICHPSKHAAEAAHHLFASFVSQRADSAAEGSLAEQLGVFYVNRSMQGYPEFTPLEGLVAGIAELVRCLPAGSVTIRHCIDQLVGKTEALISSASLEDEAPAQILALLIHLLLIVDIQVLPHLMHQLSKLVLVSLPPGRDQEKVINEMLSVISDCEDYIRKPMLVAWLQSLAFLRSRL